MEVLFSLLYCLCEMGNRPSGESEGGVRCWRFKEGGEGVRKNHVDERESEQTGETDGGCQAA